MARYLRTHTTTNSHFVLSPAPGRTGEPTISCFQPDILRELWVKKKNAVVVELQGLERRLRFHRNVVFFGCSCSCC